MKNNISAHEFSDTTDGITIYHKHASPYAFKKHRTPIDNFLIEEFADKHMLPIWKVIKMIEEKE